MNKEREAKIIDLTKELPEAIVVNGNSFELNTSYRIWIKFYKDLEKFYDEVNSKIDVSYVFKSEVPHVNKDVFEELVKFLYNPSVTPNFKGDKGDKVMDYYLDGDYIFSALYQTYGIDITEVNMHWHKFKALVDNVVGNNTLFGIAKVARSYKRKSKNYDYEKDNVKNKEAWALPKESAISDEEIEEFNAYFGGGEN